jgi:hypothetical protein
MILVRLVGPQPAQHLKLVDLGELQVEQDKAGEHPVGTVVRQQKLKSLGTVAGDGDLVE